MKLFGILIAIVSVVIATVLTAVSYKTGEILDPWSVPRTYSDKSIYRNIPLVRSL